MSQPPKGWKTPETETDRRETIRQYKNASRGIRLQKVLADAGVASRRHCEDMIEAGEVAVNGHVITDLPIWVDPEKDRLTVRGKPVKRPQPNQYVMLFKPRGVVCSNDDPEGRRRAIDLVKHPSRARLYPVGRLDIDSSGLLLLTNDGALAERLTHPRFGIHKVYEVTVTGSLNEQDVRRLEKGVFLTDERKRRRSPKGDTDSSRTAKSRIKLVKQDRDRTRLVIELREGRNRQIRRMMARYGYHVKKLRRIRMGPIRLKDLQPGQWRDLLPRELIALRKAAGLDPETGK